MDWKNCKKASIVKQVSPDINLANSLLKNSLKKLESQELLPLNETTASSKLSLAYDALRELLEALAALKGFKIYNHECYCAFLKEIMNESLLGDKFDEIRKLRNKINYLGKEVTPEESKHATTQIKELIKEIKNKHFKN